MKYIGKSIKRKIDPRLLRGNGRYIGDIKIEGTLSAAFLRSPHAHARIQSIDLEQARRLPGVIAVFGPDDGGELPSLPFLFPYPSLIPITQQPLNSTIHHVGEPIAMVIASSRYIAEDALDLIKVDYQKLPAVAHLEDAVRPDSPLAHEHLQSNQAAQFQQSIGDAEAAMKNAAVVVKQRFKIGRVSCLPIETRGMLAIWNNHKSEPTLEVYATTQSQHEMRRILAESLNLSEHQVRVIAPDVGGAFGAKAPFYVEDLLVAWASMKVEAPVRWLEDRMEHMMSSVHEREQIHEASLGVTEDGKIIALTDSILANTGAYVPWGIIVPIITSTLIPGPYKVPNYLCDVRVLYTNTVPLAPFRGAGRPQAALILNRLLDEAAFQLGMDPMEIKRKNLIQHHEFPYNSGLISRDGRPQIYDSGNYQKLFDVVKKEGEYDRWIQLKEEYRKQGRNIGIGTAFSIESTAFGSYEGATVRVEYTGEVTIFTGASNQGQGHETSLAQVAAEVLSVPIERITLREGDTGTFPYGTGTFASRIATIVGTAIYKAAQGVKERALKIAAHKLSSPVDSLELSEGFVQLKGDSKTRISLGQLAHEARGIFPGTTFDLPVAPGLEVTDYFAPQGAAITSMADMAVVEVDPETFKIKVLNYAGVHDCGTILNPMIVTGQTLGGISNGIGNALYEEVVYDSDGQLLTSTLMDYIVPTANEMPECNLHHIETPSPLNPLGIKGTGESGSIPVLAVIQSAVQDALRDHGIRVENIPVKPSYLKEQFRKQEAAAFAEGKI
ncbi:MULTISPECIES: xanthine dehydrogenase family protein molybdopterin-binding subunit [unclassified Paenibacillus]|uniref:xanthine dehydrogenase family protein molybdopterin-binding subunit n=1 Tax=unclassified Paenibacillus TaxID=185978 RepID=UPI001AE27634|nr:MULTISPECIES: xanthine dehydrogenase family protein molybdopterin-binding subunit [unclassified Paenibacillus]MBP1154468.1 CO/xanthine dehydrogenase Mo-binding subunit [Paenibacillus sp. PvP091]MBP1170148.1 CO/xanthine dehydrogenase Mo-binding subunit [Paenibacillus sp. PvR098]MBP2441176.1 CO/xanthine dehydrogenase Mo-binding subunit [Paenibacillus sp. PvP052]